MNRLLIASLILVITAIMIAFLNRSGSFIINIIGTARTPNEHRRGLMFRKEPLPNNSGLLFEYNKPQIQHFWMKNTYIDLDILFLDENNIILGKCENLKKHTLKLRSIGKKAKYAIEMNSGTIAKMGLRNGYKVSLSPG
jgi:uncharacterized protein